MVLAQRGLASFSHFLVIFYSDTFIAVDEGLVGLYEFLEDGLLRFTVHFFYLIDYITNYLISSLNHIAMKADTCAVIYPLF